MTGKAKVVEEHAGAACRKVGKLFEVRLSGKDTKVWTRGVTAAHAWRNAWHKLHR